MGPSLAGSIGNLPPVSVPLKPAARLSARQVSSGVSPPSCGRSSLDQAMGAMPKRISIKIAPPPFLALALGMIGRPLAHALALAHRGHADIPPRVARRPLRGLHLDVNDIGTVGLLGPCEGLLQLGDRRDALGDGAHRF